MAFLFSPVSSATKTKAKTKTEAKTKTNPNLTPDPNPNSNPKPNPNPHSREIDHASILSLEKKLLHMMNIVSMKVTRRHKTKARQDMIR